jgi:hypothetical protein
MAACLFISTFHCCEFTFLWQQFNSDAKCIVYVLFKQTFMQPACQDKVRALLNQNVFLNRSTLYRGLI